MHKSRICTGARCAHDISMNPYFDRPLTRGIVTFSTRTFLNSLSSTLRRSCSLALNSKFPTYSVACFISPCGLKCTAWSTWFSTAWILAISEPECQYMSVYEIGYHICTYMVQIYCNIHTVCILYVYTYMHVLYVYVCICMYISNPVSDILTYTCIY